MESFNPCFNGTYSLTKVKELAEQEGYTSFNPCFNGTYSLTMTQKRYILLNVQVLILVLMELIL